MLSITLREQIEPFATDRNDVAPCLGELPNNSRSNQATVTRHEYAPAAQIEGLRHNVVLLQRSGLITQRDHDVSAQRELPPRIRFAAIMRFS